MRLLEYIFWFVWFVLIIFLILTFNNYSIYESVFFLLFFFLLGIIMYFQATSVKRQYKLRAMIRNINLSSLEEGIKKIEEQNKKFNSKIFSLERKLDDFDNYKIEEEKKYRELVRKILELDNELNKKYKLLGESVIKLSKDIKK